jgi:hypothetical protein
MWRDEGKNWNDIAKKFIFTSVDWGIATEILNY